MYSACNDIAHMKKMPSMDVHRYAERERGIYIYIYTYIYICTPTIYYRQSTSSEVCIWMRSCVAEMTILILPAAKKDINTQETRMPEPTRGNPATSRWSPIFNFVWGPLFIPFFIHCLGGQVRRKGRRAHQARSTNDLGPWYWVSCIGSRQSKFPKQWLSEYFESLGLCTISIGSVWGNLKTEILAGQTRIKQLNHHLFSSPRIFQKPIPFHSSSL